MFGTFVRSFNGVLQSPKSSDSIRPRTPKITAHTHTEKLDLYVEPSDYGELHVFAGNANRELAAEVAAKLSMQCGRATVARFVDGETNVVIHDSVRGNDIFIIQSMSPPRVNDNLMELIFMISALRRASAKSITAVIPYYGYSRQSKMRDNFKTMGAADVALLLETVGVDRVISMDLHEGQIEGFFSPRIPVDNLQPYLAVIPFFAKKPLNDPVFVAPSAHGVARTKKFFDLFVKKSGVSARMAMVIPKSSGRDKDDSNTLVIDPVTYLASEDGSRAKELIVIGEIKPDSDVIIVDDMVDSASRAVSVSETLRQQGCGSIYMFATHGLFSGEALKRITDSPICELVVTNTIPIREYHPKVRHLSIAGILAECIRRMHSHESVDDLYSTMN